MARIAEKNPKYRTKAQMISDAVLVLSSDLSYAARHSVLAEIFWHWTEFDGKYNGCRFWTPNAIAELKSNPLPESKKYRHEHVVPKRVLIQLIFGLPSPTASHIEGLLSSLNFGVVVTKEEDARLGSRYKSSMPAEFDDPKSSSYRNPWLRYERCGLQVLDTHNNNARVDFRAF